MPKGSTKAYWEDEGTIQRSVNQRNKVKRTQKSMI